MINKEKKWVVFYYATILSVFAIFGSGIVLAVLIDLKLPFPKDEKLLLTQGYDGDGWTDSSTTPTHAASTKDRFALDLTKGGCKSYDQPVLAVANGMVEYTTSSHKYGEPNSYGNQVLVLHDDSIYSRYAHLYRVLVKEGDIIKQGQKIGTIGNTGNVKGSVCKEHPATHLHLALYKGTFKNGIFTVTKPLKPEPMSGYGEGQPKGPFVAGEWYTSDNELFEPNKVLTELPAAAQPTSLVIRVISWLGERSGNVKLVS